MIGGTTINSAFGNANSAQYDNVWGWQVHHNTFIGVSFTNTTAQGMLFPGYVTDVATNKSYAYNNLFYNCANPRLDDSTYSSGAVVHDYNAYLACTTGSSGAINSSDETVPQRDDNASNPLNTDYTINQTADAANAAHVINTGKTGLGSPFNIDRAGNNRDATPDIGAYEYGAGTTDTTPPAAPSGLAVN